MMKNFKCRSKLALLTLLIINVPAVNSQVCSTPTKDGDNLALNGTVNSYWTPNNGTYNSGSSTITLSNRRGATNNISSGDLVLVIQIQCANINTTDTDAYGDGVAGDLSFGSPIATGHTDPVGSCLAGNYEYLRAGPATNSTTLDLSQNPLTNTYVQANITNTTGLRRFQVIRVPQYNNVTLSGTITTPDWNGESGGIAALDVANQLDFNGNNISVDGQGFRGGGARARSANNAVLRYRSINDTRHASKGEGIVSTPRYVSNNRNATSAAVTSIVDLNGTGVGYPSGTANPANFARGAPGNAGGGGTFWSGSTDNGGGGAGGNGGAGGRGGAGWKSSGYSGINANYSNLTEKKWGFGGSAFSSSVSRIVFGGGGGAGDNNNNSTAVESNGAAGGGIVLIRAREILGSGVIFARGAIASNNSLNDGAGAGGAGGSVIVVSSDMSTSTLTINAQGGRGGDTWLTGTSAHGTGGGGGGGVVYRTGAATVNVLGGINGLTNITQAQPDGAAHGAKPGDPGVNSLITVPGDTPGINTGFRCLDYGDAPSTYGLANHNLNTDPNNLRIGAILPDGDRNILNSIPSASANSDDLNNASDDEDGVTLPSTSTLTGEYTAVVNVLNNSGSNANLCGWMDFDQDGIFQSDEAVCSVVSSMASSQNINIVFTVPVADRNNSGNIFSRFRLSTNTLTTSDPTGFVDDGEVEDHIVTVTTLPVSIYKFNSRLNGDFIDVNWGTASETRNAGFNIWGVNELGTVQLNEQIIPSKSAGVLRSTEYTGTFDLNDQYFDEIALSAIDIHGKEEIFGYYKIGEKVGRNHKVKSLDWDSINSENKNAVISNKRAREAHNLANKSAAVMKTFVTPNKAGMQQVTYEDLLAQGIDLLGVRLDDIAVSLKTKSVARFVGEDNQFTDVIFKNSYDVTNANLFGPNNRIEFWANAAEFPDATYLDFYSYEISVNPELVKKQTYAALKTNDSLNTSYLHDVIDNQNNEYGFIVASADPWFAKRLVSFSNDAAKEYSAEFEIDEAFNPSRTSLVKVTVSGGTALSKNPDHEVSLFVNGQIINTTQFDGVIEKIIVSEIPQGILSVGANTISVRLTDGVAVAFDIVNVDEIALSYARVLKPLNRILNVNNIDNTQPLAVNGFNDLKESHALYSFVNDDLYILETDEKLDDISNIASNGVGSGSYWVSSQANLYKPAIKKAESNDNLISNDVNYLIVSHPAFMPAIGDESHSLNQYIRTRSAEGWNIKLVSITDIQTEYGGGMNLPGALTSYIKALQNTANIEHVLLVGNDSYDYKNYLGINSTSYIPTKYVSTIFIPHTPSDALLTDLDDDSISDISLGRWPVRSLIDLDNIVTKTLNWSNVPDLSSIYMTDIEESQVLSFELQAKRLIETIENSESNDIGIQEIYPNQIELNSGENKADKARELLFNTWESKHTLSNFLGHGSPTQWSRQGILASGDLDDLNNQDYPTLIGTLSCYSSYFISPVSNSLSLNLMNGVNGIPNGAVAIHGAATLSSYTGNEIFANHVLEMQLQGKTLGEAILSARALASSIGYADQAINWILLGDPTLKLNVN